MVGDDAVVNALKDEPKMESWASQTTAGCRLAKAGEGYPTHGEVST